MKRLSLVWLLLTGTFSYGVQTSAEFEKAAQEIAQHEQQLRVERVQKIKELGQKYNDLQDGVDALVEKIQSGNLPDAEKTQLIAALAVLFAQQREIIRDAEQLEIEFARARAEDQLKMTDAKEEMIHSL